LQVQPFAFSPQQFITPAQAARVVGKRFSRRVRISFPFSNDFSLPLRTVFPQERSNAFAEIFIEFPAYY
jgi:hypothetical protein